MNEKTIQIHDLQWHVFFVSSNDPRMNAQEEDILGLTIFSSLTILVRRDIPQALFLRTLRHELTHATLFSYGLFGEELGEEGVCNFVEAYGQKILETAEDLVNEQASIPVKKTSKIYPGIH